MDKKKTEKQLVSKPKKQQADKPFLLFFYPTILIPLILWLSPTPSNFFLCRLLLIRIIPRCSMLPNPRMNPSIETTKCACSVSLSYNTNLQAFDCDIFSLEKLSGIASLYDYTIYQILTPISKTKDQNDVKQEKSSPNSLVHLLFQSFLKPQKTLSISRL